MALRVQVTGLSHIGIRVHELVRSRAFYELLGFEFIWGPSGPENVCALRHRSGLEINLIVNAPSAVEPNILMDVPQKHAGITHIALRIEAVATAEAALKAAGVAITGKRGTHALFVRDPDRNVIELAAD
jgi:lactoylglutathione lyase